MENGKGNAGIILALRRKTGVYARAVLELHPRAIVEDAPVPCYA